MANSLSLPYTIIVCLLLILVLQSPTHTTALLHDIAEVIDLSNIDLHNYEFFKNLPSQNPKTVARANPVIEHFQKKKAILDYLENLFLGTSPFTQESEIVFDPHFGRAWHPYFERKYGRRGEHLVTRLGQGYSPKQLRREGAAAPKHLGRIYYPGR